MCTLYDPMSLRVRVDVNQAQVAAISAGMEARATATARPDKPYEGRVVRVVQEADINRTTLQVHVRIADPDAILRPEMLCQVRFIGAAPSTPGKESEGGRTAVRIPARLVGEDGSVWVVDPVRGTALKRKLGVGARDGEWVEVLSGLDVSDKVIDEGRNGLEDGRRVRVRKGG